MKLKIALRNLYISQSVILVFLIFAYFIWFPHSFTEFGGFFDTAWMLIFVDLILGPILVYFIYNENKKYLKFDINALLGIQLLAFLFGAYSLYLKHPAYAVFSVDRFVLTNVSNIYPQPSLSQQLNNHLFSQPELVVAQFPQNIKEKNGLMFDVMLNGLPDIDSRPKYFKPLNEHINTIMEKSISIERLVLDTKSQKKLILFKQKYQDKYKDFAYFPLTGNNQKDMIWVFDKQTGKPIDILDINPWKIDIVSNIENNK